MKEKPEDLLSFGPTLKAAHNERENSRSNSISSKNDQPFIHGERIKKFSPLYRQVNIVLVIFQI